MMKNAMEAGWAVVNAPKRRLTDDESRALIMMHFMEKDDQPPPPALTTHPFYRMVKEKCENFKIEATPAVMALVAMLSDRPGVVSMYVAALHYINTRTRIPVTIQTFVDAFEDGIPDPSDLEEVWVAQKVERRHSLDYDNMLDRWESYEHEEVTGS